MKSEIITQNIWQQITATAKNCKQKCYVAVAYIGNDGAAMLPLVKSSKLVVDASKGAIASGQTNPAELLLLLDSGVEIYSYRELHAKVFVLGSRLFIGSNNVSARSQERLQEAVFMTAERDTVAQARDFIKSLCIEHLQLDRSALEALLKLYNPPKVPQAKDVTRGETPNAYVVRTVPITLTEPQEDAVKRGKEKLKRAATGSSRFQHEYFVWDTSFPANSRDVLFVIFQNGRSKELYPEAIVLHKEPVEGANGFVIFHSKQRGKPLPFKNLTASVRAVLSSVKHCSKVAKKNLDILRTLKPK